MLTTVQIQRIKHLQLQGFSPAEAARMQKVTLKEVLEVYNDSKIFSE